MKLEKWIVLIDLCILLVAFIVWHIAKYINNKVDNNHQADYITDTLMYICAIMSIIAMISIVIVAFLQLFIKY